MPVLVQQPEITVSKDKQNTPPVDFEKKSGEINIVKFTSGRKQRLKVFMKVFANEYEHHTQIYTDAAYKLPFGCLSLEDSSVMVQTKEPTMIQLELCSQHKHKSANMVVLLEAKDSTDAAAWADALTPADGLNEADSTVPCFTSNTNTAVLKALSRSLTHIFDFGSKDTATKTENVNRTV